MSVLLEDVCQKHAVSLPTDQQIKKLDLTEWVKTHVQKHTPDCVVLNLNGFDSNVKTLTIKFGSQQSVQTWVKSLEINGQWSRPFYSILDEVWFEKNDNDGNLHLIASASTSEIEILESGRPSSVSLQTFLWSLCLYMFLHNRDDWKKIFTHTLCLSQRLGSKPEQVTSVIRRVKTSKKHTGWAPPYSFVGFTPHDSFPPSEEFISQELFFVES